MRNYLLLLASLGTWCAADYTGKTYLHAVSCALLLLWGIGMLLQQHGSAQRDTANLVANTDPDAVQAFTFRCPRRASDAATDRLTFIRIVDRHFTLALAQLAARTGMGVEDGCACVDIEPTERQYEPARRSVFELTSMKDGVAHAADFIAFSGDWNKRNVVDNAVVAEWAWDIETTDVKVEQITQREVVARIVAEFDYTEDIAKLEAESGTELGEEFIRNHVTALVLESLKNTVTDDDVRISIRDGAEERTFFAVDLYGVGANEAMDVMDRLRLHVGQTTETPVRMSWDGRHRR